MSMTDREPPKNPPKNVAPTKARQGVELHRMRYVLMISLILIVVAFLACYGWVFGRG